MFATQNENLSAEIAESATRLWGGSPGRSSSRRVIRVDLRNSWEGEGLCVRVWSRRSWRDSRGGLAGTALFKVLTFLKRSFKEGEVVD